MGTLRTLFAISVVFAHTYGAMLVGGQNAVRLFYMVSGFLISYVLIEKKIYSSLFSFYINRYLRIYPIYATVALFSVVAFYIKSLTGNAPNIFRIYNEIPMSALILLLFSNTAIFLQDWIMFLGIDNNILVFSENYSKNEIILYEGLLLPQAWTLGVELEFYLIAPFVLRRTKLLICLILLSIALRVYLVLIGLGLNDPWSYRFFPTELALFLIGALSHQTLLPYFTKNLSNKNIDIFSNISTYFLILITLIYWAIPLNEEIKTLALIFLFFIMMPFAFVYQSRRLWDKFIGDLSYPIYITHLLVFNTISFLFPKFFESNKFINCLSTIIITLLVSIILNKFVANPVEKIRNRFRRISK